MDRQLRRAPAAPAAQCLGDHEVDGDAEAAAPRTRVGGEREASGSQGVFEQRLVQQLGREQGEVGIGRCRDDDQVRVAGVQIDRLGTDKDQRVHLRTQGLQRIQKY